MPIFLSIPRAYAAARTLAAGGVISAGLLAGAPLHAAPCAPPMCAASGPIQMTVQQFRAGNRGDQHWAQANLRIVNAGRAPLTLGYVDGSGQLLDENANTRTRSFATAHAVSASLSAAVSTPASCCSPARAPMRVSSSTGCAARRPVPA
jgi:hypothetical protein